MKNLFLASSFADVSDVFAQTEKEPVSGKTVTFIPTASLHEEVTFYVDDAKNAFIEMGLDVDILEVSTASKEEIISTLERNDFIYVSGGNTFFLLQTLKRTQADLEIIRQVEQGKMYIGESAGSMILSPDIEYVKDMDDVSAAKDLSSYKALGLIDFYPVPHYRDDPFREVTERMVAKYSGSLKIEAFSNIEAFRVQDNKTVKYKVNEPSAGQVTAVPCQ